jgi:activating signal cointegrator 1
VKALPLWQPWASLVALGAKRVETRGYPPERLGLRVGQRIAIHATKTDRELRFCDQPFFRDHVPDPAALPLGAVIATCTLVRASQITAEKAAELARLNPREHAFGDYTPGRWAWVLGDVEQLLAPVPFRGSQGTFDAPDELIGHARVQGTLL